jgi:RimJ/RimL family protein N-acetyltransferase
VRAEPDAVTTAAERPTPGAARWRSSLRGRARWGDLIRAAVRRLYERDDFVVLRRDLRRPVPPPACHVSFRLVRLDDASLARFKDMPPPFPRHHQYRFQYGQRHCYAALVDDAIVALMWPSFREDNARVVSPWRVLLADEGRIGSIWADPRYRGTGLMASCIERFARHVGARGVRYLYACTWVGNHASIRLHERLGFERVGSARRYALRWQRPGRGLYLRSRILRDPAPPEAAIGPVELPEVLP